MLIGVVLLLCLATVPLAGGRLGALADVRFRASGLAVVAILGQIVIISLLPQGNGWLHHAVHLATYALIAAFLWANRHIAYLWLAALGGALNLVAITANGGVMPASADALAAAGLPATEPGFESSAGLADPRLAFLGDVFAIPASWPLSNVFSVGDVCIGAGLAWGLHRVCGSRLVPRWTGNAGAAPPGQL
jgi:Family of unknown function (DUF5317)